MKKRGGNKLKYQVTQALKKIYVTGISKKAIRDRGLQTGIHSHTQMRHALSVGQNFVKWARTERGITDLFQLKRSHYRDYIEHMKSTGVSTGHLINIETNLRLLSKGMDVISKEKNMKPRDWVPKTRLIHSSEREKPVDRSHSHEELEKIRERLSPNAKIAADIQCAFGLRLREIAKSRVAHIQEKNGKLYWVAVKEKTALNTAHGVTKAGRPREVPCHPAYEARVREIIAGKKAADYISPIKYNSLKSEYSRKQVDGSHSFRHTYAREMLRQELEARGIEKEGREILRRMLESRAAGYRRDYGITKDERTIYEKVIEAMDKVHEYLGHGSGRIDLAEVYLS